MNNMHSDSKFDRSKMPDCAGFKDIKIQQYEEFTLDNGMNFMVLEDKKLPLVTSRFLLCSGSIYDKPGKSGTASVLSDLILKGTKTRTAIKIAGEIEKLGADLTTDCNVDLIVINAKSLKKYFGKVFDILTDVMLNPVLKKNEIERLRAQRINNLLYYMNHGSYIASKMFINNVHKNSPYGKSSYGDLDSINNLSQKDLFDFYRNNFRPDNIIAAFIGDITAEEAKKLAIEKFSGWKTPKRAEIEIPDTPPVSGVNILVFNKEDFVQSDIYMGHASSRLNNPDFIPMMVLNTILGGTFTSRLNSKLREKHGLTYGISSAFNLKKHTGEFVIRTSIKNEFTGEAINIILEELLKITSQKAEPEEIMNAKNYLQGTFPLQLETPSSIASGLMRLKFHDMEKDFYNTVFSKMEAITADDVFEIAQKNLHPENLVISVAGKADEIAKQLEQIGDITVINKL